MFRSVKLILLGFATLSLSFASSKGLTAGNDSVVSLSSDVNKHKIESPRLARYNFRKIVIDLPKPLVTSQRDNDDAWHTRSYDFTLSEQAGSNRLALRKILGEFLFWSAERTRRFGWLQGQKFATTSGLKGVLNVYRHPFENSSGKYDEEEWYAAFVVNDDQTIIVRLISRTPSAHPDGSHMLLKKYGRKILAGFRLR